MTKTIPVYDICTIDEKAQKDLLIERFGSYLSKHYQHLQRPHRHSFYHLVLFTKGKGSHTIDFETFSVKPFQVYFMIPGQVHSWHFKGEVDGYIIHFNESLISSFLQNGLFLDRFSFFQGHATDSVCHLPVAIHGTVLELFERMLQELEQKKEYYMDVIRLKLMELFITINRFHQHKLAKTASPQKRLLLKNFQQLIEKHYKDIRLPKEYAELLYITPNHLNALCQDLLGKTAGDVIRDRVLLEAKRLLTNADMTVTEIAYELNFQDNSYFNRFFKKEVGITPEAFRQQITHS